MHLETIVYAGHSAVFIHAGDTVLAIDPWLEGNPRCPDSLKNPPRLDLIALTHGHSDHAGDVVRLHKQTGCTVAATWELSHLLIEEGVDAEKIIFMNKGGTVSFGSLSITLTHAIHSSSYDTKNGPRYAGEAGGIVISDGKRCIYHCGDTALFSDLKMIGDLYKPQIALIPIGDRFTMGPKEAALAAQLIGAPTVIPLHYATFDALSGTLPAFKDALSTIKGIQVTGLAPGQALPIE